MSAMEERMASKEAPEVSKPTQQPSETASRPCKEARVFKQRWTRGLGS